MVLVILLVSGLSRSVVVKRQRLSIEEIEETELATLIKKEYFVAVLYHDESQVRTVFLDMYAVEVDSHAS